MDAISMLEDERNAGDGGLQNIVNVLNATEVYT